MSVELYFSFFQTPSPINKHAAQVIPTPNEVKGELLGNGLCPSSLLLQVCSAETPGHDHTLLQFLGLWFGFSFGQLKHLPSVQPRRKGRGGPDENYPGGIFPPSFCNVKESGGDQFLFQSLQETLSASQSLQPVDYLKGGAFYTYICFLCGSGNMHMI